MDLCRFAYIYTKPEAILLSGEHILGRTQNKKQAHNRRHIHTTLPPTKLQKTHLLHLHPSLPSASSPSPSSKPRPPRSQTSSQPPSSPPPSPPPSYPPPSSHSPPPSSFSILLRLTRGFRGVSARLGVLRWVRGLEVLVIENGIEVEI